MVDSRQTGERSGIIPWIRQCVLFRHHVPPRDRAAAVVLSPSLMRRRRGLRQHVSEMNVAFMALLCVYAVIRQIIREGPLRIQVPLHLVVATSGGLSILPVTVRRPESLFVNHLIVEKIIIIFLLVLWGFDTFRTVKRKRYDPAIEAADASERHQWRYLRWGFRIIQVVAGVYILVQLIQVLLR